MPFAMQKPRISMTSQTPLQNKKASKTTARKKPTATKVQKTKTPAELIGLTRTEAFGIAQNAHRLFVYGQQARGRKIMEGLVVLNPLVSAFHALLGAMCGRMGDENAALLSYQHALAIEPAHLSARVNRAELLLKRGQFDVALEDLIAATRIDPRGKTMLGKRALHLARFTSSALRDLVARNMHTKSAQKNKARVR